MFTPEYEPAPEPDRTPRANTIVDAPVSGADCARDYWAADDVRAEMDKQRSLGRA
jgi:hypothetical protein